MLSRVSGVRSRGVDFGDFRGIVGIEVTGRMRRGTSGWYVDQGWRIIIKIIIGMIISEIIGV